MIRSIRSLLGHQLSSLFRADLWFSDRVDRRLFYGHGYRNVNFSHCHTQAGKKVNDHGQRQQQKTKTGGRTDEEKSNYYFSESESLMRHGMMTDEFREYCAKNLTAENHKEVLTPQKHMTRDRSIQILEDKHKDGYDNIKRLVYIGKKASEKAEEQFHKNQEM